jgi:D-alanyl-D-alanine carboxypeptidase
MNQNFRHIWLAVSASMLLVLLPAQPTSARTDNSRYAAFVVDANTGSVLHSRRSQAQRHPASLTKMMTLYLLFQALEEGEIGLDDQIRVSRAAASASPSRLDLVAGSTIRVEDAIRALVIKSANDVAVAVGERLSGNERRFAQHMTTRGEELGLQSTIFQNASGLPNTRQTTTARDMARLAVALNRDFPQYLHYFQETSFVWNGTTYENHNSLVGRVDGVTGLKTGYIRASGFNVVVTATRGDHRLITVVLGGPTAASRDAHAEELLEAAFDALESRAESQMFARLDSPRVNPARNQIEMGSARNAPPVEIQMADDTSIIPASFQDPEQTLRVASSGHWSIQVGAYNSVDAAHTRLSALASTSSQFGNAQPAARAIEIDGNRLWRARFEALSAIQADNLCNLLAAQEQPCFTIAPGT